MAKFDTPRVPIQTPMYGRDGKLDRTWIIFFERLARRTSSSTSSLPVIGWDLQDTTVQDDVSDPVIPDTELSWTLCAIRVKDADPTNDLEIDIRNNGVSIFNTRPLIAAGTSTRNVHLFNDFASFTAAQYDDLVIDVKQGGVWACAVYLI